MSCLGLRSETYSVTVSKTGFDSFTAKGVMLHPAVTSTVQALLKVGGSNTEVTVSAVASEIETTTADNSNSVQAEQVNTLPINGRNYQGPDHLDPRRAEYVRWHRAHHRWPFPRTM